MQQPYLSRHCRLDTNDLDQAREAVGRLWYEHQSQLRSGRGYDLCWNQAELPRVGLSFLSSSSRLHVVAGPVNGAYLLTMNEAGVMHHRIDGRSATSTPEQAVLHVPGQRLELDTEPFEILLLKLNSTFVDEALGRRFEARVRPKDWGTSLRLSSESGRCLQSLCRWLATELDRPNGWLQSSPKVTAHLERSVLALFLDSIAELHPEPRRGDHMAETRLAHIEMWLESHYGEPIGVEEMAAVAGVSARSIQAAFRRLRGCTPSAALTRIRLEQARRRLSEGNPATRVTDVATACGFFHFGRFAGQYQRLFGQSPSATLRQAAGPIADPPASPPPIVPIP